MLVWTIVFDKDPPPAGLNSKQLGYPPGTNLGAVCGGAPGCQNPVSYTLPNSGGGQTSGGYYDTLGRRFYLGLKAQF